MKINSKQNKHTMCSSKNWPYSYHRESYFFGTSKGVEGAQKPTKTFEESMKLDKNFKRGWEEGVQTKKPSVGDVDIFCNNITKSQSFNS